MPNDAKFGMTVGVGLVVAVALVFFRKDVTADNSLAVQPAASSVAQTPAALPAPPRAPSEPIVPPAYRPEWQGSGSSGKN
jgi:hypothetical protein